MIQLGEFLQIISPVIYAGALVVSKFQFSSMRKNILVQNMQQTYATTTQALFSMFNSKEYLEMSRVLLFLNIIHWLEVLDNTM